MKNIKTFQEFLNEKASVDFGLNAQNLKDLKPGDIVWRKMTRDNPQLGTYVTYDTEVVLKKTPKTLTLKNKYSNTVEKSDQYLIDSGQRKYSSEAAYGSAYYTIHTHKQAKTDFESLKKQGTKISSPWKELSQSDAKEISSLNENISSKEELIDEIKI